MGGRLFVSRRTVDLPGKEKTGHGLRFETLLEAARIVIVVFDRIPRAQEMRMFETRHHPDHLDLHVKGQACRHAVGINLVYGKPFGFQEHLMAVLVGEALDLVFDRRAVPGPDPLNHARVHGGAIQIGEDQVVHFAVGARNPAGHLFGVGTLRQKERKSGYWIELAPLHFATAVVDGAPVDARRGPRLQTTLRHAEVLEAFGKTNARGIAHAAGRVVFQADVFSTTRSSTACWKSQRFGCDSTRRRMAVR